MSFIFLFQKGFSSMGRKSNFVLSLPQMVDKSREAVDCYAIWIPRRLLIVGKNTSIFKKIMFLNWRNNGTSCDGPLELLGGCCPSPGALCSRAAASCEEALLFAADFALAFISLHSLPYVCPFQVNFGNICSFKSEFSAPVQCKTNT